MCVGSVQKLTMSQQPVEGFLWPSTGKKPVRFLSVSTTVLGCSSEPLK